MGRDQIEAVVFGDTGGVAVTPGLRAVINPIYRAVAGNASTIQPFLSRDPAGFASIGTWTALFTNPGPGNVSYDMVGLVSQNDRLFAALAFDPVTLVANETIAVEWTILLRGQ